MLEMQTEEREVLQSIYDGDGCFTQVSDIKFQYRYGVEGAFKSFNVEIEWGLNYPNDLPLVSMDTFYNGHVANNLKTAIQNQVLEEAKEQIGTSMTFTLFEMVRDKLDSFLEMQPESVAASRSKGEECLGGQETHGFTKVKKKEQLTKSQKRRHFDRVNQDGEMPRGHDWVSLIRHLQQTGAST